MEFELKVSFPSWLLGLVVLILAPLFFWGGADFYSAEVIKNLWDFGHIIFFSVLLLLLLSIKPLAGWREWLWVSVGVLVLGGIIEIAQSFVGRNVSWNDVLHNLFGAWLGLFWGQKPTRKIWCLRVASVCCVLPSAWLIIDSAWADVTMRAQFPVINRFESRAEIAQVRVNGATKAFYQDNTGARHDSQVLAVQLSTQQYAGISLVGPYGNWAGHQFLVMDFYNPDPEPLVLVLKISDYQHDIGSNKFADRFNYPVVLTTGWNEVRIKVDDIQSAPKERDMQLDAITGFAVFAAKLPAPRTFYLDNIRLE